MPKTRRSGYEPFRGFQGLALAAALVPLPAIAGMPILVSVSAPTLMARRVADEAGITLLALARDDSALAVTHPERISL